MLQTVRTTIDLRSDLMRELKYEAISLRRPMKEIVHLAVEKYFQDKKLRIVHNTKRTLLELKSMAKWGKKHTNLTAAIIKEREKLAIA